MDTVIQKGTVVTESYMSEAIGAGGHRVFAGGPQIHKHRPGGKNVGRGVGDPTGQSTIRWQED